MIKFELGLFLVCANVQVGFELLFVCAYFLVGSIKFIFTLIDFTFLPALLSFLIILHLFIFSKGLS